MWNWVKTILRVFSGATSEQEEKMKEESELLASKPGSTVTSGTSSVKQEITQVASMQEAHSKTAIETRKDANPQKTEMHPIASLIIPIKAPNSGAPAPNSGAPFSIFTSIATVLVNLTETLTKKSPEEEAFQRLIDKKVSELMQDRPQTTHENLNQYLQQQEQGIKDGVTKEYMEKRSAKDPDFMKLLQIEENLSALLEQRILSAQSKPGAGGNGKVNQPPQQFGFTSETKTWDGPEAEKPPTQTSKKVPNTTTTSASSTTTSATTRASLTATSATTRASLKKEDEDIMTPKQRRPDEREDIEAMKKRGQDRAKEIEAVKKRVAAAKTDYRRFTRDQEAQEAEQEVEINHRKLVASKKPTGNSSWPQSNQYFAHVPTNNYTIDTSPKNTQRKPDPDSGLAERAEQRRRQSGPTRWEDPAETQAKNNDKALNASQSAQTSKTSGAKNLLQEKKNVPPGHEDPLKKHYAEAFPSKTKSGFFVQRFLAGAITGEIGGKGGRGAGG